MSFYDRAVNCRRLHRTPSLTRDRRQLARRDCRFSAPCKKNTLTHLLTYLLTCMATALQIIIITATLTRQVATVTVAIDRIAAAHGSLNRIRVFTRWRQCDIHETDDSLCPRPNSTSIGPAVFARLTSVACMLCMRCGLMLYNCQHSITRFIR